MQTIPITMTDSKQPTVLNVAPTIDQINADRITQVFYAFNNNKILLKSLF